VAEPQKSYEKRKIVEKGKPKTTTIQCRDKGEEVQQTKRFTGKEDLGTRVGERPVRAACAIKGASL